MVDRIKFHSGGEIPLVSLGTFQLKKATCETIARHALDVGYRSIDTARCYKNEVEIGAALASSGVPRNEVFLTSKIAPADHGEEQAYRAVQASLNDLNVAYLDLMLIHWPGVAKTPVDSPVNAEMRINSWKGLLRARSEGLVKDIGVSNFTVRHLESLLTAFPDREDWPVVNQVELHPLCTQSSLRAYCASRGIVVQAYSSLGSGAAELIGRLDIVSLAEAKGMSVHELLLMWAVSQGIPVIPKTASVDRLTPNLLRRFFEEREAAQGVGVLSALDIDVISSLNTDTHFCWNPEKVV